MSAPRVVRVARRRGAFGLDERRLPDPVRVEAELRDFLAGRLPEVWPMPAPSGPPRPAPAAGGTADATADVNADVNTAAAAGAATGRTLALLLPRGHVAVLRIDRDPARPDTESVALADRCRAMHIPHATVSSLAEGRAALRRFGVEPRAGAPAKAGAAGARALGAVFGRG